MLSSLRSGDERDNVSGTFDENELTLNAERFSPLQALYLGTRKSSLAALTFECAYEHVERLVDVAVLLREEAIEHGIAFVDLLHVALIEIDVGTPFRAKAISKYFGRLQKGTMTNREEVNL